MKTLFYRPKAGNSSESCLEEILPLLREWSVGGICTKVGHFDDRSERFEDFDSFFGDFSAEWESSFSWRERLRPPSIFYVNSLPSRLIELWIDGEFRIALPSEMVEASEHIMNDSFDVEAGVLENSDLYDDFLFFRLT